MSDVLNHFSANVGRPAVVKNDYLENERQARLNKARGQGYAGVIYSSFSLFV
jgi:hypothetical protein